MIHRLQLKPQEYEEFKNKRGLSVDMKNMVKAYEFHQFYRLPPEEYDIDFVKMDAKGLGRDVAAFEDFMAEWDILAELDLLERLKEYAVSDRRQVTQKVNVQTLCLELIGLQRPDNTAVEISSDDLSLLRAFIKQHRALVESSLELRIDMKTLDEKPMWIAKQIVATTGMGLIRKRTSKVGGRNGKKMYWYGIDEEKLNRIQRIVEARKETQHEKVERRRVWINQLLTNGSTGNPVPDTDFPNEKLLNLVTR